MIAVYDKLIYFNEASKYTILIEYEKIEKWDGRLPTVSGSGALVCVDGIAGE